jgi:iron complex transport system permease protein
MTGASPQTSSPPSLPDGPGRARVTGGQLLTYSLVGLGVLAVVGLACSFIGSADWSKSYWSAAWGLRLTRLTIAAIVGAGLSAAGLALQGLLRNPLAEPYILGISSGASVGVGLGPIIAGMLGIAASTQSNATGEVAKHYLTTPALAVVGAMLTCLIVYGIAQRRGRLDPYVLLLSGVIVNVFNGALILVIMLYSSRNQMLGMIGWGMGSISENNDPALLWTCGAVVAAGWVALFLRAAALNAMNLGDTVASSSGVPVHWLRVETFVVVGVITSACVSLSGPVGFVGLIVPHVCRMLFGPDHRKLAILSALAGAAFLMIADTLCRVLGAELGMGVIPVGVLTALAGGPFFIFLLRRRSSQVRV